MKQYGWPRPAALIGYVLSGNLETYLFISVQRYGFQWLTRTGVIILAAIIFGSLAMGVFYQRRKSATASATEGGKEA
jgi:hypothetical protein